MTMRTTWQYLKIAFRGATEGTVLITENGLTGCAGAVSAAVMLHVGDQRILPLAARFVNPEVEFSWGILWVTTVYCGFTAAAGLSSLASWGVETSLAL